MPDPRRQALEEARNQEGQTPPADFELATHDAETGKQVGWVPVGDGPEDARHREAFERLTDRRDGTYELNGPSVQGNPEHAAAHMLVAHADCDILDAPREFGSLAAWLAGKDIEGLVWHHADGRMAKIKLHDFGLKRGA